AVLLVHAGVDDDQVGVTEIVIPAGADGRERVESSGVGEVLGQAHRLLLVLVDQNDLRVDPARLDEVAHRGGSHGSGTDDADLHADLPPVFVAIRVMPGAASPHASGYVSAAQG